MRLVLDTNIVVSALLWGGPPYQLLQLAVQGHADLFTSPALAGELSDVLARPKFSTRLAAQNTSAGEIVEQYLTFARLVTPQSVPPVVPADQDDDQVIACAVAANADLIVSGDQHLLSIGAHKRTGIVTVAQAIAMIDK